MKEGIVTAAVGVVVASSAQGVVPRANAEQIDQDMGNQMMCDHNLPE
jgi:hypothetical protein